MEKGTLVRIINPLEGFGRRSAKPVKGTNLTSLVGKVVDTKGSEHLIDIPHISDEQSWLTSDKLEILSEEVNNVYDYIVEHGLDIKSRKREVVWPRYYLFKYLSEMQGMALKSIGSMFGGMDHSTVQKAVSETYDALRSDTEFVKATYDLHEMFPIIGQMDVCRKVAKSRNVLFVNLSRDEYLALSEFKLRNKFKTNEEALKKMIKANKNVLLNTAL